MSSAHKPSLDANLNNTDNARDPTYDAFAATAGSVPLLVKTPDGERHQIDIPPNSSIRDLKVHIANLTGIYPSPNNDSTNNNNTNNTNATPTANNNASASQAIPWDLDFAGSVLNENHTLEHYNIPDVYDHTNGLLKTISDSGYDDPEKKVEALDKALNVVRGISRGERDMERLITSVFEEDEADELSPTAQPTLSAMRRSRRSHIPALNFSHLAPIGAPVAPNAKDTKNSSKSGLPSAPPTPSQLIRRLSNFRPDLYDPKVIEKVAEELDMPNVPSTSDLQQTTQPKQHQQPQQQKQQQQLQKQQMDNKQANDNSNTKLEANTNAMAAATAAVITPPATNNANNAATAAPGSGELKHGNSTWFADVISSFGTTLPANGGDGSDDDGQNEIDADSEGEDLSQAASISNHQNGNSQSIQSGQADSGNSKSESNGQRIGISDTSISGAQKRNDKQQTSSSGNNTNDDDDDDDDDDVNSKKEGSTTTATDSARTRSLQQGKQVIGLEPEISMTVPAEPVRVQKKRGRKRKNPHLSEEERKAQRQAQNRESAKLSRIRRKNMTIEYEKRVNTLEGENENLRDTVAALTGRLEMLQNLLTISVQKRAMPDNAIAQLASAQQQQHQSQQPQHLLPHHQQQPQQSLNPLVMKGPLSGLATTGLNIPGLNNATPGSLSTTGQLPSGVGITNSLGATGQTMPPSSGALPNLDFNNM